MIFLRDTPPAPFKVGDEVRISDGPFASFNGVVEEIDGVNSRMRVAVSIFGPPTRWNSTWSRWRSCRPVEAASVGGLVLRERRRAASQEAVLS
jgi:hypothetical protein